MRLEDAVVRRKQDMGRVIEDRFGAEPLKSNLRTGLSNFFMLPTSFEQVNSGEKMLLAGIWKAV
ncbi:hypothetical protein OCU04_003686 [Sclerotinia nivalis]|uniref:Uncharacterized protein n=1 Tax=Sclerotinia nivalis TaxID=352851 RepID=A0A9X0ASI8_9HELO|nr:hypothetical protein OCU04_003686 [Sclerotinia nivalis]